MHRAEVRDGYVYVIDTNTGRETFMVNDTPGKVVSAVVTGDDELTVTYDIYGGSEVRYRISTGHRA